MTTLNTSMVDRIVYSRLINDATIYNLVNEILPASIFQNAEPPVITYAITATDTTLYLDGIPSPLEYHQFDIGVFANHQNEVQEISQAVKDCLHGWRGGQIRSSHLIGQLDAPLEQGFGRTLSFQIVHDNEVISQYLTWTRGSDEYIRLRNLTNPSTGQLVNDATVNATIFESDETTVVHTLTLPYTGTAGRYQGEVDSTITATMLSETYRVRAVAVSGLLTSTFWATIRVLP